MKVSFFFSVELFYMLIYVISKSTYPTLLLITSFKVTLIKMQKGHFPVHHSRRIRKKNWNNYLGIVLVWHLSVSKHHRHGGNIQFPFAHTHFSHSFTFLPLVLPLPRPMGFSPINTKKKFTINSIKLVWFLHQWL